MLCFAQKVFDERRCDVRNCDFYSEFIEVNCLVFWLIFEQFLSSREKNLIDFWVSAYPSSESSQCFQTLREKSTRKFHDRKGNWPDSLHPSTWASAEARSVIKKLGVKLLRNWLMVIRTPSNLQAIRRQASPKSSNFFHSIFPFSLLSKNIENCHSLMSTKINNWFVSSHNEDFLFRNVTPSFPSFSMKFWKYWKSPFFDKETSIIF